MLERKRTLTSRAKRSKVACPTNAAFALRLDITSEHCKATRLQISVRVHTTTYKSHSSLTNEIYSVVKWLGVQGPDLFDFSKQG